MGHALILSTASKAALAGGAFADNLAANVGDQLAPFNFTQGGARILEMWGIDSDSVAEVQFLFSRGHDPTHGLRLAIPALTPGGAGLVASRMLLPGYITVPLYPADAPTVQVSGTAGDDALVSWLTEYDDLTGIDGQFVTWPQVQNLTKTVLGIQVTAVASATPGAYGAARAFNADDDRLHADTWYAILGATWQTPVTTISLIGPDWGNQRIGMPAGAVGHDAGSWFIDQSLKWGKGLIPVFNSNNKGNITVQVADAEASTSPHIDFVLAELSAKP